MENEETLTTTPSEVVDTTSTNEPVETDTTSSIVEPENKTEAVETSSEIVETSEQVTEKKEGEELILGKYKTLDEAVEGLKNQQSRIDKKETEAIQQLNEKLSTYEKMFQQAGFQDPQQFQNAQVEQALSQQYQNDVATIEQAYQKKLQQLNSLEISEIEYNQSLAYIEDLKVNALANSLANDRLRRHEFAQQQAQLTKQQFEAQKNAQYEQYKEHKDIIDLFYDGQPTIQKAIALKEAIGQKAVEAYKASLQANQENNNAISQMNSAVNGGQSVNDNAIPTTWDEVVNKMDADPKWYTKNQAKILEMKGQGLIK